MLATFLGIPVSELVCGLEKRAERQFNTRWCVFLSTLEVFRKIQICDFLAYSWQIYEPPE